MGCLSVIKEESIAPERSRSTREIAIRLIDHSPLTQTTGKFLTNRLPSSMIRARTKLSSKNKKKKKERKIRRDVFHFSLHKFHCFDSVRLSGGKKKKKKRKTKPKLDNRATRNTVETRRSAERGLC